MRNLSPAIANYSTESSHQSYMLALFVLRQRGKSIVSSDRFSRRHVSSFSLLPPRNKPKKHCKKAASTNQWNANRIFVPSLSIRCESMSHLKQIQSRMIVSSLCLDALSYSRLVAFCAHSESGDVGYCKKLLLAMPNPDAFSWNVVMKAFSDGPESFLLYKEMLLFPSRNLRPDKYTFPLLFKACARLQMLRLGHEIFVHALKMNHDGDIFVRNALVHFLVSCGRLESARVVFDESPVRDVVTWNSLINGYVKCGREKEALRIYGEMIAEEDVAPDEVTMIGVVTACAQLEDLSLGRDFHRYIRDRGMKTTTTSLSNALMDMYVKCGDLDEAKALFEGMHEKTAVSWTTIVSGYARSGSLRVARKQFDEMPEKDVVPWNAMMKAYVQANRGREALSLFREMQMANVRPDAVTMVTCLSACSQLGALDVGIWIHRYVEKHNLSLNVILATALVDMYVKCGNIARARRLFHETPGRNALTYTALINGLALHGDAEEALKYFADMVDSGLAPDDVTFLGVLSACCHGGLVREGRELFSKMSSRFGVVPRVKHYSIMVDLLGRAGLLEEAMELIEAMPVRADAVVWGAMFFACRTHKNVELGERAARELLELDPSDGGIYTLLASMYVEANMWDSALEVRRMMRERGVDKTPACSAIEIDGNAFKFVVRDKSHSRSDEIYECLLRLSKQSTAILVQALDGDLLT